MWLVRVHTICRVWAARWGCSLAKDGAMLDGVARWSWGGWVGSPEQLRGHSWGSDANQWMVDWRRMVHKGEDDCAKRSGFEDTGP